MSPKEILRKRKKIDSKTKFTLTIVALVLFLVILLIIYVYYYFLGGRAKSYINRGEFITVLFAGIDSDKQVPRTDTIFVGVYNPITKKIGIINIPRDLKVNVESSFGIKKPEKINAVYSKYGIKKLISLLENLLGIDIVYYVTLDIDGFIKIVDILGGVEVYIEKEMNYIDHSAGLYIHLPKGSCKLDGLKAMKFVRYRADERGDFARMERQIEFIISLIKSAVLEKNVLTNIKLIKIILKYIKDTNIKFSEILNILNNSSDADYKNLEIMRIPGKFVTLKNIDYIEPDLKNVKELTKNFLVKLKQFSAEISPAEVKVQVLNGCGKPGMAKLVRDKLVRNGFNVVEFGNAESQEYEETIILDRVGNLKKTLMVAKILNCNNIYSKINPFILLDVTIIVGKDYKKYL